MIARVLAPRCICDAAAFGTNPRSERYVQLLTRARAPVPPPGGLRWEEPPLVTRSGGRRDGLFK